MGVTSSGSCGPSANLPFTYGRINMLDMDPRINHQVANLGGDTNTFTFRISTVVEKLKAGMRANIIVFILPLDILVRSINHKPSVSSTLTP